MQFFPDTYSQFFFIIPVLIWLGGVALGLLLLYQVIKIAVRRALREHHLWVQQSGNQPPQGPQQP